jgi:hypothetical protein
MQAPAQPNGRGLYAGRLFLQDALYEAPMALHAHSKSEALSRAIKQGII